MRARAAVAGAAIAALLVAAPISAARDMDWCAPMAVRPDQAVVTGYPTCRHSWTEEEIASYAEVVFLLGGLANETASVDAGFTAQDPFSLTCWGKRLATPSDDTYTHPRGAQFIAAVNAKRPPGMTPIKWIAHQRWELLASRHLAMAGFQIGWTLTTATPWASVEGFFSGDTSSACGGVAGTCSLVPGNHHYGSTQRCRYDPANASPNAARSCLRELLNQRAGQDPWNGTAYQSRVFYLGNWTRPRYWVEAVFADLRQPAYRAWRIALAREAFTAGGATHIDLNHKLAQWAQYLANPPTCTNGDEWIGSACAPDVAAKEAVDAEWSAQPAMTFGEYVIALGALADELAAQTSPAMPFAWSIGRATFGTWDGSGSTPDDFSGTTYDDPGTPANEARELRRIALERASLVLLSCQGACATANALKPAIEAGAGHPAVIVYDDSCPISKGYPKVIAVSQ